MQPIADQRDRRRTAGLALAAIGVVFGDIGTSPLYALRECFHGPHAIAPNPAHVMGVLSLSFWSLIIVISIKYLLIVMRADNNGEGGILALMALVCPPHQPQGGRARWLLVILGLFGAALLYGDGMITPAISVLSAVEGLNVATPLFEGWVRPITIAILIALFAVQRRGTASVGSLFGPICLVWFACIAALGLHSLVQAPEILKALSPGYALAFFVAEGWHAFVVMGTVFLVITGGEALYADMGHFGARPIKWGWFVVVLPCLLLNYFGQGALLIRHPELAANPFFHMAPRWALLPLVGIATLATIIASQAVITGAFSLTWQAVQLGYLPRVEVRHTSEETMGQIYIPAINSALLLCAVGLVLGFRTSSNLAAAYGVAVTTTMVITTVLLATAARRLWRWNLALVVLVTGFFLPIDLAFFGANIIKVADGGWFPLIVGFAVLALMTTWRTGRQLLGQRLRETTKSLAQMLASFAADPPVRTPGTAVYLTGFSDWAPPALVRLLQHSKVLHDQIVLLTVDTVDRPFVPESERVGVEAVGADVFRVIGRYGFMEKPHIPSLLRRCAAHGLNVDPETASYVLGRETLLATSRPGMAIWREHLFTVMARNAGRATEYFGIPSARVLEVGAQIEL